MLDTHIVLWLDNGDEQLRPSTRALIDDCWNGGGTVFLSAVTAWEIALLVDAGRIGLDIPVDLWIAQFLETPGTAAAPLVPRAAARSYRLEEFAHRDPADRLLMATAIELGCPLVTYDDRIVRFADQHGERYGFGTVS